MQQFFLLGAKHVFISCKKSYLEHNSKQGSFWRQNYYQTPADEAFAGLVSAYDPLVTETGGLDNTYTDSRGPLECSI